MDAFLQLTPAERMDACLELSATMSLDPQSVEKDYWVCWTLRELFTLPGISGHLTFKGGTSLSKAWKLIQRFSEDIDLVVDKERLGFGGQAAPDKAPSNKQCKARLEALMVAARHWVQQTLQPLFAARLRSALGSDGWKLKVDPHMPDGQCLLFHYPSAFAGQSGYLMPHVKIELGARSDDWPHEDRPILPYLAERFPQLVPDGPFPVRVLAAERTFWEKACLLHEETFRPAENHAEFAWPGTITISGRCWKRESASARCKRRRSSRVSRSIARYSFATRGWITPPTGPAHSASFRPRTILLTGALITKRCSDRCSSGRFPSSTRYFVSLASSKQSSTARHRCADQRATLLIQGKHSYRANVSDSATGTIASLEHALDSIDDRLRERETDLAQSLRQAAD